MQKNTSHVQGDPEKKEGKPSDNRPAKKSEERPAPETSSSTVNEPTGESRRSVTNTDEQEKITNTQSSGNALDEKETEGV